MSRQRPRASGSTAVLAQPGNGLRRSRVADLQRARLLSAMLEMCAERRSANVTVADVVARAGVSRRTFYELFADSEDCLLAALDHALAIGSESVLAAYRSCPANTPWRERVRAGLTGLLELLDDDPLTAHMLIVESLNGGARLFERRAQAIGPLIAAIEEGGSAAKHSATTVVTAEGVVGAVLSVIHARTLERRPGSMIELANPLMSMIVLPYLGPAAARGELQRQMPVRKRPTPPAKDVLKALEIRVTYRTMSVVMAIGESPGASNRQVALAAGIGDQGQISKLLARLKARGLIENDGGGNVKGTPNSWRLTARGEQVRQALGTTAETR